MASEVKRMEVRVYPDPIRNPRLYCIAETIEAVLPFTGEDYRQYCLTYADDEWIAEYCRPQYDIELVPVEEE